MDELISREYVLAEYDRQHEGPPGGARKIMEEAPAVDVMPVIHARWKIVALHRGLKVMECSNCRKLAYGATIFGVAAFCHNCGARMEKNNNE